MLLLVLGTGLLGLLIGSFLNVVVHRVPSGGSLSRPPSCCPACGHRIRARHNVPVLSWLLLGGRCADCRAPISPRYPLVEASTAVLFAVVGVRLAQLDLLAALPAFLYFVAVGVALTAIDLDVRRLPDRIVLPAYPVLAVLLAAAALTQGQPASLLRAVVGATASYAAFYAVMFAYPAGMGFGDVKLSGLVGGVLAFVSYPVLLVGFFASFLLGAVVGVGLRLRHLDRPPVGLPFGPFLVSGVLLAVLVGGPVSSLYLRLFQPA